MFEKYDVFIKYHRLYYKRTLSMNQKGRDQGFLLNKKFWLLLLSSHFECICESNKISNIIFYHTMTGGE